MSINLQLSSTYLSMISLLTKNTGNPVFYKELKIYEYLEESITECINSNTIHQLIDQFNHYMHVNHHPSKDEVVIDPTQINTYSLLHRIAVSDCKLSYPVPFSTLSALLKYVMEELNYTPKQLSNTWIPFDIHEYNKMVRNTPYLVHIITQSSYPRYTTVELQNDGSLTACIGGLHDLRQQITHYAIIERINF